MSELVTIEILGGRLNEQLSARSIARVSLFVSDQILGHYTDEFGVGLLDQSIVADCRNTLARIMLTLVEMSSDRNHCPPTIGFVNFHIYKERINPVECEIVHTQHDFTFDKLFQNVHPHLVFDFLGHYVTESIRGLMSKIPVTRISAEYIDKSISDVQYMILRLKQFYRSIPVKDRNPYESIFRSYIRLRVQGRYR